MNSRLAPLPSDDEVVAVVRELQDDRTWEFKLGVSASAVARKLGVEAANRAGNGAVKGSWSGRMSASLRISPRLRSMAKRGLLLEIYDTDSHRNLYRVLS